MSVYSSRARSAGDLATTNDHQLTEDVAEACSITSADVGFEFLDVRLEIFVCGSSDLELINNSNCLDFAIHDDGSRGFLCGREMLTKPRNRSPQVSKLMLYILCWTHE